MFRGSSTAKIDGKGRLKVPSDFRRIFDEGDGPDVFITSVLGDCALVYPLPVWEAIEKKLIALPTTDRVRRRYQARVSYFGHQARLDAQGRVMIPTVLRESAAIVGEVVVCGSLDHLEVWNHGAFTQRVLEEGFADDDFDALRERGI